MHTSNWSNARVLICFRRNIGRPSNSIHYVGHLWLTVMQSIWFSVRRASVSPSGEFIITIFGCVELTHYTPLNKTFVGLKTSNIIGYHHSFIRSFVSYFMHSFIQYLMISAGGPHGFQPASLSASGSRPITAVTTTDLSCICEKIWRQCGLKPRIASFKLNRSQTPYAYDLVRRELVTQYH